MPKLRLQNDSNVLEKSRRSSLEISCRIFLNFIGRLILSNFQIKNLCSHYFYLEFELQLESLVFEGLYFYLKMFWMFFVVHTSKFLTNKIQNYNSECSRFRQNDSVRILFLELLHILKLLSMKFHEYNINKHIGGRRGGG